MNRIGMIASGLVAVLAAAAADAVPSYIATPLGVLGGAYSVGNGINAHGEVVGASLLGGKTPPSHAFVYADGALHDLGTLGGPLSRGDAINAGGQVVGLAFTAANQGHAFLYAGGVMTDLDPLGTFSEAYGVNVSGQVTGFAVTSGTAAAERAFLYSNGVMTNIDTLGGRYSHGNGINASGQVTGRYGTAESMGLGLVDRAFLYSNGVMSDLGTLGGSSASGTAINDSGQVTGQAALTFDQARHAFLYSGNFMLDLGTLGDADSIGMGINATGQIVGAFDAPGTGAIAEHAFLYTDGTMYDLNSLVPGFADTLLTVANGINDSGQIVANGCSASTICQAFRLDPAPTGTMPPPVTVSAIEFHYPAFDHYFITANAAEIAALDNGMFPGWVRTGESFNVYSTPSFGSATVCRFFSTAFAPKSSHFYTPDAGECAVVKQNSSWQFEGVVFGIPVPDQQGNCAVGTQPVYRLYNNGQGGAPNHRYTTSLVTRTQMLSEGWIPEGYGPIGVIMCAPL